MPYPDLAAGDELGVKSSALDRMRILIIEDDPKLTAMLSRGLREHGFVVSHASDGREGLASLLKEDYDAVVLDILLPGLNGFEILRESRQGGRNVPVLVLTSRTAVEDRVRGLDLGADDYLAKPFAFAELLARLRAITRRPSTAPRSVLSVADLELDTVRHEVRRSGERVELSPREFALLEYLLRRKDIVVTRDMILQNVWDTDYDGGSNIVEVYINYLRRKLDHGHSPKLIHTVRGAGYVLRETE